MCLNASNQAVGPSPIENTAIILKWCWPASRDVQVDRLLRSREGDRAVGGNSIPEKGFKSRLDTRSGNRNLRSEFLMMAAALGGLFGLFPF